MESEDAGVIVGPELHLAKLDIADHVVDAQNPAVVASEWRRQNPGRNGPL